MDTPATAFPLQSRLYLCWVNAILSERNNSFVGQYLPPRCAHVYLATLSLDRHRLSLYVLLTTHKHMHIHIPHHSVVGEAAQEKKLSYILAMWVLLKSVFGIIDQESAPLCHFVQCRSEPLIICTMLTKSFCLKLKQCIN